jgi:homogentisate 1,2-dioxygenase
MLFILTEGSETRLVIRPTCFALETPALQRDYNSCWAGFEKLFKG